MSRDSSTYGEIMPAWMKIPKLEQRALLSYDSGDEADDHFELEDLNGEDHQIPAYNIQRSYKSRRNFLASFSNPPVRLVSRNWWHHWSIRLLGVVATFSFALVLVCGLFFPSYTTPPQHYETLRTRVKDSYPVPGAANINNEKIFIATALYDPGGLLVSGDWAESLQGLIHILGPENVHLSIYENDADEQSKAALRDFGNKLPCNTTITEESLNYDRLPHITMSDGTLRLKRMSFLAEVRNRALQPLVDSPIPFSKLLYINDIIFDPIDAANLLFSTNIDASGRARYHAACATDFQNPFKFYDTFATRDSEGFATGVIFFPWFAGAGDARSRQDVLAQKDAVRVKSCWSGMVAFEARWFQAREVEGADTKFVELPLRFRAEEDSYWDASECCLVHADLAALTARMGEGAEIYMNPYVRVAYSKRVLEWLPLTRRVERLYSPAQAFVNWVAGRPPYNPRRLEEPGERVVDRVWVWDNDTRAAVQAGGINSLPNRMQGAFEEVERTALPGSFCGGRSLSSLVVDAKSGEEHWLHEMVPEGG